MSEAILTRIQILEAAEDVLRRFGPAKATVVDVARALGVSHGSVYRHFPSKSALRDAVAERWLNRISQPLNKIAEANDPAPLRLRRWFDKLVTLKRKKALDDPELFATYQVLASEATEAVEDHINKLIKDVTKIIADGVKEGAFIAKDPQAVARALLNATTRFHHPKHSTEWGAPGADKEFNTLWTLLTAGLTK